METLNLLPGQYTVATDAATRNRYKVPADNKVLELAYSIRSQGQLMPVGVTGEDGARVLVYGFTRADAVELLRNGFEYNGKEYAGIPDFPLRAEVVPIKDAKDATLKGITENAKRNAYSPVDYAFLIQNLRDNVYTAKGTQTAKICELFGKDKAWVSRISSLLSLPQVALDLVHLGEEDGGISYSVGNEMTKTSHGLTEEDILKLCENPAELTIRKVLDYVEAKNAKPATEPTGDGTTATTTEDGETPVKTDKIKGRTIQDVNALLQKLADKSDEKNTERVRKLALKLAQYIGRGCGEENAIDKFREFASM